MFSGNEVPCKLLWSAKSVVQMWSSLWFYASLSLTSMDN